MKGANAHTGPFVPSAIVIAAVIALSGVAVPHRADAGRCGDGVVDPSEACDDGNRDDADCCSNACTANAGRPCGGGDVCAADVCGAEGVCTRVPANTSTVCGGAASDCDPSPACDGAGLVCPAPPTDASLCVWKAEQIASTRGVPLPALRVTCSVPDNVERARSTCDCIGRVPGGAKPLTEHKIAAIDQSATGGRKTRLFALHLNALGRRLLRRDGHLQVEMVVNIAHGSKTKSVTRLVELVRLLRSNARSDR